MGERRGRWRKVDVETTVSSSSSTPTPALPAPAVVLGPLSLRPAGFKLLQVIRHYVSDVFYCSVVDHEKTADANLFMGDIVLHSQFDQDFTLVSSRVQNLLYFLAHGSEFRHCWGCHVHPLNVFAQFTIVNR